MRVVVLAAGAAGMYCGSCMHNNRLVAGLRAAGHDASLLPLYTPIRTDEEDVSGRRVHYGGINVYLQQVSALFRKTPAFLDRLLDGRAMLNAACRFVTNADPANLAEMTLSVLRGEHGRQRKELEKLAAALRAMKPDVVHLPNLLFAGCARRLKETLGAAIVCSLAGEDVFVDRFREPDRRAVLDEIRRQAAHVDAFDSVTYYYAQHATEHFGLQADRVHVVPMGIRTADFAPAEPAPPWPFTIGYLAQVSPAKGLANLCRAFIRLRKDGRDCRLRIAGYLGPANRAYLRSLTAMLEDAGVPRDAHAYVGEVTREQKLAFLRSLHVFSVPAAYREAKGFYVLEAMAAGVPVVQPDHGSFPELLEATGGGLLYKAGDDAALAYALARMMDDDALRDACAARGAAQVRARFDIDRTVRAVWALYRQLREPMMTAAC